MSEEILKKIKSILTPKIGKVVTNSIIRVNCQKIGVKPEELKEKDLDAFAEDIRVSLLLFLDDKGVEEIVKKIKIV